MPEYTRRGNWGWLRRALGVQTTYEGADPMDVRQVADESDLHAAMYGPRGMVGTQPTPIGAWTGAAPGEFTAFFIRAGAAGARVRLSWELDSGDRLQIYTARGIFGTDVPDLVTEQEIAIRWSEPLTFPGTSKAFIGNHLAAVAVPWEVWNIAGTDAAKTWTEPIWVGPGMLLWTQQELEDPGAFYVRAWIEEPGSAPAYP